MQFRNSIAPLIGMCVLAGVIPVAGAAPSDPLSNPAFIAFYNNEYDSALAQFERQIKAHPNDPNLYNHVAQTILYREMFRDGALESQLVTGNNPFLRSAKMRIRPENKERFFSALNRSVALSQALLDTNPSNVSALYALGVANALRANYLFLVEKAWVDALRAATAARKANEQILDIDPHFTDAHLILGLDSYVVGSLPFYMRALGFLGGFHGDREGGIHELESVANSGASNRYDAQILLAVVYRRERRPREALPLLQKLAVSFPHNYLFRLEQVQMYSDLGDKSSAVRVLTETDDLRKRGAPGYATLPREKIDYLKGNLLFWYGDLTPALASLQQATEGSQALDLGTAVLAWLRLGQVYDLQGNHQQAIHAYQETVRVAPQSDAADEAKSYMSSPYRRKRSAATLKFSEKIVEGSRLPSSHGIFE